MLVCHAAPLYVVVELSAGVDWIRDVLRTCADTVLAEAIVATILMATTHL